MNFTRFILLLATLVLSQNSWAAPCNAPEFTLEHNKWAQISLPCTVDPDDHPDNTIDGMFGDEITGDLGTDWAIFSYIASSNRYRELAGTEGLVPGKGYWIIQINGNPGSSVKLRMPDTAQNLMADNTPDCASNPGGTIKCFDIGLKTDSNAHRWNMIGMPFDEFTKEDEGSVISGYPVADVLITASRPVDGGALHSCDPFVPGGCDLDTASTLNKPDEKPIAHNVLFRYKADSYEPLTVDSGILNPWDGFWVATLVGADGLSPKLRFKFDLGGL